MTRLLSFLDRVIDVGLATVLLFTPLAFGAVEDWAQSVALTAILVVLAAWLLKLIWTPPPPRPGPVRGAILGGRVRLSGLELPALLFTAVIAIQLVPLPPSVVRVLSPRTAEIFTQALPGYGVSEAPSFRDLPRWLQSDPEPEAGGVAALPPNPELTAQAFPPEVFDLPHPAWRPLSLTPAHTKRALQLLLAHFALFVVAFNHLGTRPQTRRYLLVLCGTAGFMSVLGILQDLTPGNQLYWWRGASSNYSFGPFVNANHFAGWMEMVLPICAGLTAMTWVQLQIDSRSLTRHSERAVRSYAGVFLLGFATIIGSAAFLMAKSRGGFLALAGAIGIALIVHGVRRTLRMRVLALASILAVLALGMAAWIDWTAISNRYSTLNELKTEASFRSRLDFGERTLRMATDFPVFGTGLGTFAEAYSLYSPGTSRVVLRRAHNDYAQTAAECGLAGLLALLWGLAVLIKRGIAPGLVRRGTVFRLPVTGAAIGVIAILLHSFVDFNLQILSNSLLLAFLCAFLMRDRSDESQQSETGPA